FLREPRALGDRRVGQDLLHGGRFGRRRGRRIARRHLPALLRGEAFLREGLAAAHGGLNHWAQMYASSGLLPSAISPSSARRRTTCRIFFCSVSTSETRTGPRDSRSSRSSSAAREDMFLRIFSRSSGRAP